MGQGVGGEEGAREEEHGGDEEENWQVEEVDGGGNGGDGHAEAGEGEAAEQGDGDGEDGLGAWGVAQGDDDGEHEHGGDARAGGAPDDFAHDDFLQGQGRGEHGVVGLLVIHAHEGAEGGFHEGLPHAGDGDHGRGEEGEEAHGPAVPGDVGDHAGKAQAEGEQVEDRFEQRRQEIDGPDTAVDAQVAAPDRPEQAGETWIGVHSRSSRPVRRRNTSSRVAGRTWPHSGQKRSRRSSSSRRSLPWVMSRRPEVSKGRPRSVRKAAMPGSGDSASRVKRPRWAATRPAGVPSVTTMPWSMMQSRSQKRSASSMAWVVSRMVMPWRLRSRSRSQSRLRDWGSRAVVGSSRMSRSGLLTMARASMRRRAMPPESSS